MAGLNGMGPQNAGPGTGRRLGRCYSDAGSGELAAQGLGFGRGFGSGGNGRGMRGAGRGRCGRWSSGETFTSSADSNYPADNNPEYLKSQRDFFASRLKDVEAKLQAL